MITAVFDCMVFLQAATNDRGPAFACLALVETGDVALAVSPSILAEVRDVLTRPKIRAKFPHLTQDRVDIFLRKVATISAPLASNAPRVKTPTERHRAFVLPRAATCCSMFGIGPLDRVGEAWQGRSPDQPEPTTRRVYCQTVILLPSTDIAMECQNVKHAPF